MSKISITDIIFSFIDDTLYRILSPNTLLDEKNFSSKNKAQNEECNSRDVEKASLSTIKLMNINASYSLMFLMGHAVLDNERRLVDNK